MPSGCVISGAGIPCEFEIPEPPPGETLDLDTVVIEYTDGDTMMTATLNQVDSAAECDMTSFYIEDDKIKLCPEACDVVEIDEGGSIDIKYGCALDEPN